MAKTKRKKRTVTPAIPKPQGEIQETLEPESEIVAQPPTLIDDLRNMDFVEVDENGKKVEGSDYSVGWYGLHRGIPKKIFKHDEIHVVLELVNNGGSAPFKTIKIYKNEEDMAEDKPIFNTNSGIEPSEEVWASLES